METTEEEYKAIKEVSKAWKEYGTPTKQQCEKILYDFLREIKKIKN